LIADKAYDSFPLRERLKKRGIDFIVPHINDGRRKLQDGRKLRRYRRRWIIERTNAWLNTNFRRLTTRWDHRLASFKGFLYLAIILVCLRRF
jgi:transposase